MRPSYEKLTPRTGSGSRDGLLLKMLAALAVGLLAGALIGVWFLGSGSGSTGSGELFETAGVPGGFERTCDGAALASGRFFQAMNSPEIALDPDASRTAIDHMAVGEMAAEMKSAVPRLVEPYANGAIGEQYRAGVQTLQVGVPVGYKTLSCDTDRAVVRLWTVTVRGNATNVWPMQFWRTVQTELRWIDGDWRIVDGWTRNGPIAYWTQHPLPDRTANQSLVMLVTKGMKSFGTLP